MKMKLALLTPMVACCLMGCSSVKGFEKEINVVFEYNGTIVDQDSVHQFKNCLVPSLSEEQIPLNHEFYGWTWLNPDAVIITEPNFESKYIEAEGVVHYDDIKNFATNTTVTLRPLFINIDDIPIPNYYIAIGWYGKTSTSGLGQAQMEAWTEDLKNYLSSEGATAEDLSNVVVKEYNGDVATAGGLIKKDRFIDILVGFGNNIDSTGGVEVIEKVGDIPMGGKQRYIARLTEKELSVKVYAWLQTADGQTALS